MPPPAFGRSGAYSVSPWCYVRTCVCAYVTFVTRFKFTCNFRCKFTSAFLLQLIIFIPSGLERWNFVWHLPTSRPFNVWYRCPGSCPWAGLGVGAGASVYCGHISSFYNILKHSAVKPSDPGLRLLDIALRIKAASSYVIGSSMQSDSFLLNVLISTVSRRSFRSISLSWLSLLAYKSS